MTESELRVELRGPTAHLGEVRATDVANLILATERAVARAAGAVSRHPIIGPGRRRRDIEAASRLRLVAIAQGNSVDIEFRLPQPLPEDATLGLDVAHLGERAVDLLLHAIDDPEAASSDDAVNAAAGFAESLQVGDRYESVALSYSRNGNRRATTVDTEQKQKLREAASKRLSPKGALQHQVVLGTLVAADFEDGSGRLRETGEEAVEVAFASGLAGEVKRALLEQARVEGERRGNRLDVQSILPSSTLLQGVTVGRFWEARTLEEQAAQQAARLVPYQPGDYLDSDLTDQDRDAIASADAFDW